MADTNTNWIEEELKSLHNTATPTGEKLPALKLESGKITKFTIDFTTKFNSWTSPDGVTKVIIPATHKGEKKNLWVNVKNPLYSQLIQRGAKGQKDFAVSTVGTQKETRYTIVDED
jgi:hypothetical protein